MSNAICDVYAPSAMADGQDRDAALHQRVAAAAGNRLIRARLGDGGKASLILTGDGLSAAARAALEAAARAAALAHDGVTEVAIALIGEHAAPARRQIIAVASGKGGVGKSTLSANLAVAMARMGRSVGLVDADIHGPSQPRLFDVEGQRPGAHASKQLIPVATAAGVPILSMGMFVEPGRALAWRGPMAGSALAQMIDADWGDVRDIIVDLPPGTGDISLSMVQKHKPVGAVIVSTPQDLALIDATRAISLFDQAGVPIIGMVENMAGYVCPHCGEASDPFGSGGAEAAGVGLNIPFLGRVPLTIAIRMASDAGRPPALGDDVHGAAFAAIARRLAVWLDARPAAEPAA